MRRLIFILVLCACVATPAFAAFTGGDFNFGTTGNYVTLHTDYQVILTQHAGSSAGGAFIVHSVNSSDGTMGAILYETFCVEAVTFNPGQTYWATCDPVAYAGGLAKPGGDPISDVTEWIYDKWLDGTYYYSSSPSHNDQANIYQAIHYAEQESSAGANNVIWEAAWQGVGYASEPLPADLRNAQHTYALNLWSVGANPTTGGFYWATDVQSHLQTVPLPAAVLLGMLGFGWAGIKLRRSV